MIKEDKKVDFYTTGRQPSEQDFSKISDWIKKDREKNTCKQPGQDEAKHVRSKEITKTKA